MSKKPPTPAQELKASAAAVKQAKRQRGRAKNVLNLSAVLEMPPTLAEAALNEINLNTREIVSQLTPEDLQRFAAKVGTLKQQYGSQGISGGITPRAVIDRSRRIDLQRCQHEIHSVLAVRQQADGVVVFRTNASAQSKDSRHMVTVQFLDFQAAINGGRLTNSLADRVLKGAVRFDCDCGRHRFWYRYIATVGGFAYGTPETGFPKVRNPELTGLGCKHVLRVMHSLQSTMMFRPMMKEYLQRYRSRPDARAKTVTAKQAAKQLEETAKHSNRQIRRRKILREEAEYAAKELKNTTPPQENRLRLNLKGLFENGSLTEKSTGKCWLI